MTNQISNGVNMLAVGVIGYGYWGPNIVRNFQALSGCKVKIVADLSSENLAKLQESYPDIKTTQNYKDILKDPAISAVAIITPAITHYKLAKESLMAKKHVFVEKPLTLSSKDAQGLINLAQRQGRILMVGNTFEYNAFVIKAKEILDSGELGNPLFLYFKKVSFGPIRSDVSVIWDFAYHDISVLTYWLGKKPTKVSARGHSFFKNGLDDLGSINLEFPDNISAHIRVGWLYPVKERGATIIGSKKTLVYDDLNSEKPITIYSHQNFNWLSGADISYPAIEAREPLKIECQHFLDCIRENRTPLTDGKRGLEIIKILEAVQKSINLKGKKISVPK